MVFGFISEHLVIKRTYHKSRMKRPLAIGIEDYKRIIEKPYYYVDKTLLIKDIIAQGSAVNLFTQPRRFGKTLTLSMLNILVLQKTK